MIVGAFADRSVTRGTLSAGRSASPVRTGPAIADEGRRVAITIHESMILTTRLEADKHRLLTGLHRHANQGVCEEGHVDSVARHSLVQMQRNGERRRCLTHNVR